VWFSIGSELLGVLFVTLLIFVARIIEASLETVRTIYISKGHGDLAAYVGIVKTGIWLLSTGLVLTNLSNYWNIVMYLAGYGIGTVFGMHIENLISIGNVIVRLITPADPLPMITSLSTLGYGMTRIEGTGSFSNPVNIIFMIVPRTELSRLMGIISREYPDVLYTIEDVRTTKDGARIFYKDPKSRIPDFFGM
jgi:uncharacterized protein YebE (UPF0316 family)